MKRQLVVTFFAAVIAAPAARAQEPAATTDEFVREVFSKIAPQFVQAVPERRLSGPDFSQLSEVEMATAFRSSGNPGLCEATVATVRLQEPRYAHPPPVIQTEQVYRVVGPLDPTGWSQERERQLNEMCGKSGNALPVGGFTFRLQALNGNAATAWEAVRVLRQAIHSADPASDIWLLELRDLRSVSLEHCSAEADSPLCVTGAFTLSTGLRSLHRDLKVRAREDKTRQITIESATSSHYAVEF